MGIDQHPDPGTRLLVHLLGPLVLAACLGFGGWSLLWVTP